MPKIEIDEARCKGCGLCSIVCPRELINLSEMINIQGYTPAKTNGQGECAGCQLCAEMCPDVAIAVFR